MDKITNLKTTSLFSKLVIIALLMGVTWVPTLLVLGLVMERSERADEAVAEIATKWSRAQTLNGPVLTIPVRVEAVNSAGQPYIQDEMIYLLPESLNYDVDLDTEVLSRGIFEANVYTSAVTGKGTFNLEDINISQIPGTIQWNNARISIGIPDTRGIDSDVTLAWNDKDAHFEPGVSGMALGETGISAPVSVTQFQNKYTFSFDMTLRGSQNIDFVPLGKTTEVSMRSNWTSPSFTGEFLPKDRELTKNGFTASWTISSFGRSLEQSWLGNKTLKDSGVFANIRNTTFGVALHQNVNFYTQVNRAIKYSILFIALTFLTFFMFEVLAKLRIHPMNYLMVGLSIAMFYLLLLSLAETISFLPAYLVSMIAVTGLITGYSKSVLKARKHSGIIAVLLLALYGYLYVLLQLDELSLILGSVSLFIILGIVMYLTRNIDWYEMAESK